MFTDPTFSGANWHNFFDIGNCIELHSFCTLNHSSALRMIRIEKVPTQLVLCLSFPFL